MEVREKYHKRSLRVDVSAYWDVDVNVVWTTLRGLEECQNRENVRECHEKHERSG